MSRMLIALGLLAMAGCSTNTMHYSVYDLNRDGVMDAVCPGMEYDPSKNTLYGWRSSYEDECQERRDTSG